MHLASLLPILSLSIPLLHALPTTESPDSGPSPSQNDQDAPETLPAAIHAPPDETIFTVTDFRSWVTTTPTTSWPSWTDFHVSTSDGGAYYCYLKTAEQVLSSFQSWGCKKMAGGRKDSMSFRFGVEFGEMEIQRLKESNGKYWTEYATQGTYWKVGPGGNATATVENGMHYQRPALWMFVVNRISG